MNKKDDILIQLTDFAASEKQVEVDVTLLVDGLLISGFVISTEKYMKHNTITDVYWDNLQKKGKIPIEHVDRPADYIYLRDAKFHHPGGSGIPTNTGVFLRVRLSSVSCFSFGAFGEPTESENK